MRAGGRVEIYEFTTILLRDPLVYRIYLPPCYDEQPEQAYPVLYLIHGQTYSDTQWDRLGVPETADQLIRTGEVAPFIVVMPRDRVWLEPTGPASPPEASPDLLSWSPERIEVAVQGPLSQPAMQTITKAPLADLKYYHLYKDVDVAGINTIFARTGYTGEDGFEIYCTPKEAPALWDAIVEAGKPFGLQPAGLGCRDTLRFEASMPLYGQEMDDTHGPIEAGLRRFVYFKKPDFISREALWKKHKEGTDVKLVGFEMVGRGIARTGYPILKDGEKVGYVTTGSFAPTLDKNLGMGFVKTALTELDTEFDVEIRGRGVKAKVCKMPFYKRGAEE